MVGHVKRVSNPVQPEYHSRMYLNGSWHSPCSFVQTLSDFYSCNDVVDYDFSPFCTFDPSSSYEPVSIGKVKRQLRQLKTNKATHSSDFPTWVSRDNAEDICVPLADIINTSFKSATYPQLWKNTEIKPLAKVADPSIPKDYRPISLLWHCGKVLEHFLVDSLKDVTTKLEQNQYAYREKRGTTDALTYALTTWAKGLDQPDTAAVNAVFIDFSKAFDSMRPDVLETKLRDRGVSHCLALLVRSFLIGRETCVVHRETSSRSSTKESSLGVPQGTLLGPVLWNILLMISKHICQQLNMLMTPHSLKSSLRARQLPTKPHW
jgi:hypothetical protein